MSSMDSAIAAMQTALQSAAGVAVTYHRGDASVSVIATIGLTKFRFDTEYGFERVVTKDYLIETADLVLDGAAALPAEGDTIEEVRGLTTYTHTVAAPGGEPPYRFSDPARAILRVHTLETALVTTT